MGSMMQIGMMVVLFAFMYFGMIRPNQKRQQAHQEMMRNLQPGEPVVTIGGLHGVVDSVSDDRKTLTINADGLMLTFEMSAIRTIKSEAK